jgi:hypothetical protein
LGIIKEIPLKIRHNYPMRSTMPIVIAERLSDGIVKVVLAELELGH